MNEKPKNTNSPLEIEEKLNVTERNLKILYEVSNAMRTTLDLDHILYIILTSVTAHTGLGYNRAVLFLNNAQEGCLEPKMAMGPESGEHAKKVWDYISHHNQNLNDLISEENIDKNAFKSSLFESIKGLRIPYKANEKNLLSDAYNLGFAMHITREKMNNYINDPIVQKLNVKDVVIMPLKANDVVNGMIIADNIYTQKTITDDDLKIFTMLANQAGLAIENSRLYEMVIRKSHTDALTNLWNHGFFQSQLREEIENGRKDHRPLSLLLMDLDNFKKLNDTYGHQFGDHILKIVANVAKESSRETDFVCRYGGEELSVILPHTNTDEAFIIAERIRNKIQETFANSEGKAFDLTISIGLAAFPVDAQDSESLIAKADQHLYSAKSQGKNRTVKN